MQRIQPGPPLISQSRVTLTAKFGTIRLPIKNEKMSLNLKVSLQGPVEFVTL